MSLTIDSEGSPIKVTGTTSTDESIFSKVTYIKFVKWHKPTTVGHLATLKDGAGREIVTFYCEVADESQWAPIWDKFDEIRSDDVDSGTLYIYVK